MQVTAELLKNNLPPFVGKTVLINPDQSVYDIVKQILNSHEDYAMYYDKLYQYFDADSLDQICDNIYTFLKREITYHEESDKKQTTGLPSYLLTTKTGDCKHYSLFTAGVLDAIKRNTGKKFKWCYRFASYNLLNKQPHHVFVVAFDGENEIWIDAIPGANDKEPVWIIDKFINTKNMALYDVIAGVEEGLHPTTLTNEFYQATQILMSYGIVNENAVIDYNLYSYLISTLPQDEGQKIADAMEYIGMYAGNVIGYSFFEKLVHGAAVVTMFLPRQAFLLMLDLNVRAWATNLKKAIDANKTGNIEKKWYLFGGDWNKFKAAVNNGYSKKMIGCVDCEDIKHIGEPVTATSVAAAIAAAAPIIAAIVPLLRDILKALNPNVPDNWQPGDPLPGDSTNTLPGGNSGGNSYTPTTPGTQNSLMQFVENNLMLIVIAAGGLWYVSSRKEKVSGTDETILLTGLGLAAYLMFAKKADNQPAQPKQVTNPVKPRTLPKVIEPTTPAPTPAPTPAYQLQYNETQLQQPVFQNQYVQDQQPLQQPTQQPQPMLDISQGIYTVPVITEFDVKPLPGDIYPEAQNNFIDNSLLNDIPTTGEHLTMFEKL